MKVQISKINTSTGDYYRFYWPKSKLRMELACDKSSIDDFELVKHLLECIYLLRVKNKITDIDEKHFYIQGLNDRLWDVLKDAYWDDVLKS